MKTNIFQIIENNTGTVLNQKTLPNLEKMERSKLVDLIELIRYSNQADYTFVDNKPPTPKLTIRQAILTDSEGNQDSYEMWNNTNSLKNLLLYYPSLTVIDPIEEILELAAVNPNTLVEHINNLLPLRELIEKEIVNLVPSITARSTINSQINLNVFYKDIFEGTDLNNLFEAVKSHSPLHYQYIMESDLDLPGFILSDEEKETIYKLSSKNKFFKKDLIMFTAILLKELYIQNIMALSNNSNLGLISTKQINFFKTLGEIDYSYLTKLNNNENLKSKFLLDLQLQEINDISWQDVISIRNNDEDFYTWRNSFSEILKESQVKEAYDSDKFIINAKETMIANSRIIATNIKEKKSLKNKLKNAWVPAGIGFLGGMLTGSVEMAALQSGAGGSLQFIYELFTNKTTKGEEALLKHFSLFTSKQITI